MKLLIVTQTVDRQDPVLGFFHRWIEEFAKNCERVHVMALNVGEHDLPDNVTVHCLGKSEGRSKLVWLWRLWSLSWSLRHEYDATFVHMNPIHMAWAGIFWRVLGKQNGLWYTHPSVDTKLRLATRFTHVIYTGSDSSFNIKTRKKNVMGQGIDPNHFAFKENIDLASPKLIVVGRVSPIKHIENAIDALVVLRSKGVNATLQIVGGPMSVEDEEYLVSLKQRAEEKGIQDYVEWSGALPADQMQKELSTADVFVHTSLTHSADKTLPEAMSSGLFVVSSNRAYEEDLPAMCFKDPSGDAYADSVMSYLELSESEQNTMRRKLRSCVEEKHSLSGLVKRILALY